MRKKIGERQKKIARETALTIARRGTLPVSFKLPPDVIAGLDEMAAAEGRSRNSCVRFKLAEIVEDFRNPKREEADTVQAANA